MEYQFRILRKLDRNEYLSVCSTLTLKEAEDLLRRYRELHPFEEYSIERIGRLPDERED